MKTKSLFEYIEAFANSHVGSVRSENQDFFGVVKSDTFQAFFVTDGMGGARGGQIAASECVRKMGESLKSLTVEPTAEELRKITKSVNKHIYDMASNAPEMHGMGTTLVGLTFCRSRVLMVSVGDSRVYRHRGGKLYQLSVDHTVWNDLVISGSLEVSSDFAKEISHMLTRSMGPDDDVEPDITEIQVEAGDTYLLCSDGLYNMVSEGDIVKALKSGSAGKSIDKLIKLANNGGGKDNITALVIKVKNDAYGVFPSCKESLPGLRECDPLNLNPALISQSSKYNEVIANKETIFIEASASSSDKRSVGDSRSDLDIKKISFLGNQFLIYLIAIIILTSSMFITIVFGIKSGFLKSLKINCYKQTSTKQLTDKEIISALKNRQFNSESLDLTDSERTLIELIGSPNCSFSQIENERALNALSASLTQTKSDFTEPQENIN